MMRKTKTYYICDIDRTVNDGKSVTTTTAMRRVASHIISKIDPTFPTQEFVKWVNSPSEKPFKHNRNIFYWEDK